MKGGTRTKNKILLITYHFPPSTAIGGMRIASFARYFPAENWDTCVLTIKDRYLEHKDMKRLESLEDLLIFKAMKLISLQDIYLKTKSVLNRWRDGRKKAIETAIKINDNNPDAKKNKIEEIKHFINSFLLLPDEERNWIIPATFKTLHVLQQEKIDCILTSCPPYSVHMVGLLATLILPEIKWIADFRDPWMVPLEKKSYPTTSLSNLIEYRLEKAVIHRSNLVLTTTKKLAETFIGYYNQCPASKFKLIPNGFDLEIDSSIKKKYCDIFTISYTGALYFGRTPEPVFKAIASLIKNNKIVSEKICLKLVGDCRRIEDIPTGEMITRYGLESVVKVIDPVPLSEAQQIIKQSHVALLLAPEQPYQIPAKTYEYMGLGTPILALTGDGATSDLINSIGIGKAIHPDNIDAIEEYILEMITCKDSPGKIDSSSIYSQYTRKIAAQKLVRYINHV